MKKGIPKKEKEKTIAEEKVMHFIGQPKKEVEWDDTLKYTAYKWEFNIWF